MSYTTHTYGSAPRFEDMTPKQRRRTRDLLAFVLISGRMPRGLHYKQAAGSVILFCTGWPDVHASATIDDRTLREFDVANHPLCKLHALLVSAGYTLELDRRGRVQNHIRYIAPTGEQRDRISLYQISRGIHMEFAHSERVETYVRAYAEQVGGWVVDRFLNDKRFEAVA